MKDVRGGNRVGNRRGVRGVRRDVGGVGVVGVGVLSENVWGGRCCGEDLVVIGGEVFGE